MGTILITTWHHLQGINEIPRVKSLTPDLAPEKLATTSGCYYPLILLTRHSQSQRSTCCCNTAEGWQLGKLSRFHPRRGSRAEANKLTGMSLSHCGPSFPSLLNKDNFPLCLLSLMKFVTAIQGSQGGTNVLWNNHIMINTLHWVCCSLPKHKGILAALTNMSWYENLPEQSIIPLLYSWDLIMYSFGLCYRLFHAAEQQVIN